MRIHLRGRHVGGVVLLLGLLALGCGGGKTRNLILITLDGVRVQELFYGMDPLVAARAATYEYSEIEAARARYWRDKPEKRREALMPFFWKTLAPMGVVYGNKDAGSSVTVTSGATIMSPATTVVESARKVLLTYQNPCAPEPVSAPACWTAPMVAAGSLGLG